MPVKRKSKSYFSETDVSVTSRRIRFQKTEIPIPEIADASMVPKKPRNRSGCLWTTSVLLFVVAQNVHDTSLALGIFCALLGVAIAVWSIKLLDFTVKWTITVVSQSGATMKYITTEEPKARRIYQAIESTIDELNNSLSTEGE